METPDVEYEEEFDLPPMEQVNEYLESHAVLGLLAMPQDPQAKIDAWLALHEIADIEK